MFQMDSIRFKIHLNVYKAEERISKIQLRKMRNAR